MTVTYQSKKSANFWPYWQHHYTQLLVFPTATKEPHLNNFWHLFTQICIYILHIWSIHVEILILVCSFPLQIYACYNTIRLWVSACLSMCLWRASSYRGPWLKGSVTKGVYDSKKVKNHWPRRKKTRSGMMILSWKNWYKKQTEEEEKWKGKYQKQLTKKINVKKIVKTLRN